MKTETKQWKADSNGGYGIFVDCDGLIVRLNDPNKDQTTYEDLDDLWKIADLIASAPELLETCKDLLKLYIEQVHENRTDSFAIDKAQQAIQKAESK